MHVWALGLSCETRTPQQHTTTTQKSIGQKFDWPKLVGQIEIPTESWEVTVLPLSFGGLGLRSGPRVSPAAYWSSWADCLVTTAKRQPAVAELLVAALTNEEPGSYLVAAADARRALLEAGFHAPSWRDFVSDHPPRPGHNTMDDGEPGPRQGWQVVSSMSLEEQFVSSSCGRASRSSPVPCSGPRRQWRVCLSPVSLSPITAGSIHSRSVCFFCAASGSLFPPLCAPAGVACHSTLVATTAQRAPWWGSWDVGVSRRVQPHGFAVRQGAECRSTSVCRTWIWPVQTRLTTAVWRLWLMGSPFFREHNSWPWTPRSCQS